ncbi:Hmcn1 [Symbiodinium pilosum]|uniref:Hmcn1 protein n=1 Tax=Symbiodinium pilosum TaxID=2952 RepID=A0A812U3X4_SYMPI|nr:Hmcn1 [Symbiodinium pilosum]
MHFAGIGSQNRNRVVITAPKFGGVPCGNLSETQRCTNFCMDCQLSDWTTWASCSKTCAGGSQYVQRASSSLIQLEAGSESSTGAWGYQKKMGVRCDPKHQRSTDGVGTPQEAEALCSADPTCGGLYDRGCDNWVTMCDANFTLESEEGSCSYLKKEIGRGEPCQGNISETMTCNEQMCPVDCVMTDWTDWSPCDPFCNGTQKRERNILKHAAYGGTPCGPTLEDQRCSNFCVDCAWTDWTLWPACTVSCGGGTAQRTRSVAVPKQGGGQECSGSGEETKTCSEQDCPVDCEFSTWTTWTSCQPYCEGSQTRQRSVTRKAAFGGKSCNSLAAEEPGFTGGVTKQIRQCSNLCRDCGWLDWTPFSSCSATCGNGTRSRSRDQLFVLRTNRSGTISAFAEEPARVYGYELQMNMRCDVASRRDGSMVYAAARDRCDSDPTCGGVYDEGCDGTVVLCNVGFSLHEEAGSCSATKLEIGGGSPCEQVQKLQVEHCNTAACPRDCQYGDWSAWTVCEPWCNGTQARNRGIVLEEEEGGKPCFATAESRECSNHCVNCRWADWSSWNDCSASCGGGNQTRARTVTVPKEGRGEDCVGNDTETRTCADLNCPVNCELSDWTAWSSCQPHCLGEQNRSRKVLSHPRYGGAACGSLAEQRKCANLCMDCMLSGWEEWGDCSASCGGGRRKRLRTETYVSRNQTGSASSSSLLEVNMQAIGYEKKMGVKCDEAHQRDLGVSGQPPLTAQASCSGDATCGALYDKGCKNFWAVCDAGFVLEEEEGSCSYIKKEIGEGEACEGNIAQNEDCNIENCPLDCEYTEWTEWSTCEPFCSGLTNRTRNITREPQNGGLPCSLKAQVNNCTNFCVDCEWGSWTQWSNCSTSCNSGTRTRSREVAVPADGGGKKCSGNGTEVGICADLIACPVDCEMTDWGGWTPCTPYCDGKQQRSRSIITQPYAGGAACGETAEEMSCNNTCVNCQLTSWTDWSECSKTCSGGTQHRSRGILKQAEGQGTPCPTELEQTKEDMCAPLDCPVDCIWGDWLPWNGCSVTCGEGTQDRTRVEVVSAQYGGLCDKGCDLRREQQGVACLRRRDLPGGRQLLVPVARTSVLDQSKVEIGNFRFRCSDVLGRGSYGEVWRAQVLSAKDQQEPSEVALKEVLCRNQSELRQAIFEVQVLLALERAASPHRLKLRVPRCIAYKVNMCSGGWKVRTAMTLVPGQSLDYFLRQKPPPGFTVLAGLRRALSLVACLLRDIGPALQLLGPIAWHRDVNSHNILIDGAPCDHADIGDASFWLIDFGLAVDSQSWVSEKGRWRTEYIGGDSRYWPPSSWIMHLVGPEGFDHRPDLCDQYQRRLDIHGLGVTALELLCTVAMACLADEAEEQELQPWTPIFHAWTCYREAVWQWWATVYAVFSVGGDLAPVQAQLVEERIVEQLLLLLTRIRIALRNCAAQLRDDQQARLLQMIADMLDEGKAFELRDIQRLVGGPKIECLRRSTSVVSSSKEPKESQKRFYSVPTKSRQVPRNGTVPSAVIATTAGLDKSSRGHSRDVLGQSTRTSPMRGLTASWQSQMDAVMTRMASLKSRFQARPDVAALDQKLAVLRRSTVQKAKQRLQCFVRAPAATPLGGGWVERTPVYLSSVRFFLWYAAHFMLEDWWSHWGNCSATCDSGFQFRNRSVSVEKVGEGADCDGHAEESEPCAQQGCPRDCIIHDWQQWSDCSQSCGPGGKRKRIRDAESEIEGGRPCNESNEEYEVCGLAGCPRDCIWGDWGGWSNCTKSCGKGIAFRNRIQLVVAAYGGSCVGSAVQTEFCNSVPCPEDCTWNDWGEWTTCTQPCGGDVAGTRSRLRTKSGPFNAGEDCVGFPTETVACNAPGGCSVNCTWEERC